LKLCLAFVYDLLSIDFIIDYHSIKAELQPLAKLFEDKPGKVVEEIGEW
jgi:hypothetical protein